MEKIKESVRKEWYGRGYWVGNDGLGTGAGCRRMDAAKVVERGYGDRSRGR